MQQKVNKVSNSNANIAFSYNNTLRKKLILNKTETEIKKDIGVYRIPCKECDLSYFGGNGKGVGSKTERTSESI